MPTVPKHTVLVIDDEPDMLQSVRDLLRFDVEVLTTTCPTEVLAILASRDVHVVMTDQRMPEVSGVELLEQVRQTHPDIVRILFTGYTDLSTVIDAINRGAVHRYLTKPWAPTELQSVIRQACERYELTLDRRNLIEALREKNLALQRADVLKTEFIRVMAHELRTPITLQLGLTQLALRADVLSTDTRERLERIESAARRLSNRAEQLLLLLHREDFAQLRRSPVDLDTLFSTVIDDLRPFTNRRCQSLSLDLRGPLGELSVDSAKIQDALVQLLLNAVKFTHDGGHIGLMAERTVDGGLSVEVSDDGVGVPTEDLEALFEPFFTGHDTEHHSSGEFTFGAKGLGLGLSLVRTFVSLHGGKVWANSQPGRTVFTLTLPKV